MVQDIQTFNVHSEPGMLIFCIALDNQFRYVLWVILTLKRAEWVLICYGAMVANKMFEVEVQRGKKNRTSKSISKRQHWVSLCVYWSNKNGFKTNNFFPIWTWLKNQLCLTVLIEFHSRNHEMCWLALFCLPSVWNWTLEALSNQNYLFLYMNSLVQCTFGSKARKEYLSAVASAFIILALSAWSGDSKHRLLYPWNKPVKFYSQL